jgi:hypothetical protein
MLRGVSVPSYFDTSVRVITLSLITDRYNEVDIFIVYATPYEVCNNLPHGMNRKSVECT